MQRRNLICLVITVIVSAALTPLLYAQPLKKIRIGSTTPSITTFPNEVAVRKGFFKEEGLEPEMITIRSADIIVKALLTDHLDYATPLASLVAAGVKGLPIKVIGVVVQKTTYVMVSHPSIQSIKDLKGKVIGISSFGSASDYAVRVALQRGGLNPRTDTTIIQVGGSAARLSSLQAGIIAATVLVAPFNLEAEKMGYRSLLWLGKVMDLPQGGYAATDKKLEESPDEAVRVMKAASRGISFIKSQRGETIKIMMDWMKVDRPVAEAVYPILNDSLPDFGLPDDSVILSAIDAAKFQARIDKEISLNQVRNWSFAKEARDEVLLQIRSKEVTRP